MNEDLIKEVKDIKKRLAQAKTELKILFDID